MPAHCDHCRNPLDPFRSHYFYGVETETGARANSAPHCSARCLSAALVELCGKLDDARHRPKPDDDQGDDKPNPVARIRSNPSAFFGVN